MGGFKHPNGSSKSLGWSLGIQDTPTLLRLLPLSGGTSYLSNRNYYDVMANYHGKGKRTMNKDLNLLLKMENADFPLQRWLTRGYCIVICRKELEISVFSFSFSQRKKRLCQKKMEKFHPPPTYSYIPTPIATSYLSMRLFRGPGVQRPRIHRCLRWVFNQARLWSQHQLAAGL